MIAVLVFQDCIQRHRAFIDLSLYGTFFPDQAENIMLEGQFLTFPPLK